jgi:hypothetical protein
MMRKQRQVHGGKKKRGSAPGLILLVLLLLAILQSAPFAHAQVAPGSVNHQILSSIGQQILLSSQALTGYSFQQRSEVQVNGETKSVQLSQISFDPNKQPLITPISVQPPEDSGFGLIARIKRKKIKEMREEVAGLVKFAQSYLALTPMKMMDLASRAQVWVNPGDGTIRVDALNFLQAGDHYTMICDGNTKNRMQVQVQTAAQGNPVTVIAQYEVLPTGLNYNAQTTISVAAKGLQIMINTMNYQKQ